MERKEKECRCAVCGRRIREGALCECCKESLALCDVEEYAARKMAAKFCGAAGKRFQKAAKYDKIENRDSGTGGA